MLEGLSDSATVEYFLAEIIDSFEKLDLVVHLQRTAGPQTAAAIAAAVSLPLSSVVDTLAALRAAGIVCQGSYDPARWQLDRKSSWGLSIEILSSLYDDERDGLLHLMARCALDRIRAHARESTADVFRLAPKKP